MPSTPSTGFAALLASGTTKLAIAVRVVRKDGTVCALTSYPSAVTVPSYTVGLVTVPATTYDPVSGIMPTHLQRTADLKPDNFEVQCIMGSLIVEADVRKNLFREATFSMIVFWWADPTKVMIAMRGTVGEAVIIGNVVTFKLRSLAQNLTQEIIPISGPLCRYRRVGYNGCPVVLTGTSYDGYAIRVTGAASGVTDARRSFILAGTIGFPANRFKDGVVKFTSGLNNGLEAEVMAWTTGTGRFTLWHPTPYDIAAGDTVRADSNCRLTVEDCHTIYNKVYAMDAEPGIVTAEGAADVQH